MQIRRTLRVVRLSLPMPPSANHIYRRNRYGSVFLTEAAREYPERVQAAVIEQIGNVLGILKHVAWVDLEATIHPPDKRRRDIDNVLKRLIDALAAVFGFNDAVVRKIVIKRGHYVSTPDGVLDVKLRWLQLRAVSSSEEDSHSDLNENIQKREKNHDVDSNLPPGVVCNRLL